MALEVRGLSCGYRGREVVRDVSLTLEEGRVLCLLGPNGAGKTTFFKTILGLLPPLGGSILLDGEDLLPWPAARRAQALGYVPQAREPLFSFRTRDVVLMGRTCRLGLFASPSGKDRRLAEEALEAVGARHLGERPVTELSGGERQLVLLARALAQEPRFLVLDEPTTSLDFGKQLLVLRRIEQMGRRGMGVLVSTHFPEHAFLCAHQVLGFHGGGHLSPGPPEEVLTPRNLKTLYGVEVDIVRLGGKHGDRRVCVPRQG